MESYCTMLKNRVPGCSSDPCTMSQAAPPIPAQCHPNRTFFCAEADWASPVVYFVARVSAERTVELRDFIRGS